MLLTLADNKTIHNMVVSNGVFRRMALRFVAGETLDEAIEAVKNLPKGARATLDNLGENVHTAAEADDACRMYLDILDAISRAGVDSNASIKLTQMGLDIDPDLCLSNMRKVLDKAQSFNNFVRIDMEGSAYTQTTLDMFSQLWQTHKNVGVVIQSYLYRSEPDIQMLNQMQARVRLCKGAYAEPPEVAFPLKADTDANYRKLAERLLSQGSYPGIATHDENMIEHVKRYARENGIGSDRFEFQMLYGIRRQKQEQLISEGYNLRVYVPFGRQWYPYFMRRLAERPANLMFFLNSLVRK
ncbi:MAG: proline dehydrogenase [Proteobacteria bacterium]|nr:proline dehydrogenase [Pseudomonadota bacterium]